MKDQQLLFDKISQRLVPFYPIDKPFIAEVCKVNGMDDTFIQAAELSCEHHFAFFTEDFRNFGKNINWFLDYQSLYDWSHSNLQNAHTITYLKEIEGVDIKCPWETNRCAWFIWLALGVVLNDNPEHQRRYIQIIEDDIKSWIVNNPTGKGINWVMPMEVALRAINWINTLVILHGTEQTISPNLCSMVIESLYRHGWYLEYNIEYVRNPGNHLDSNALGLIVLGAFFYTRRCGKRWFRMGKRLLEREIRRQNYCDGVNYEKSTSYHRFVTEMFTHAMIVADRIGKPFSQTYINTVRKMYDFMAAYSKPDGTTPMFGDADDGRVLRLSPFENINTHNNQLALAAVIFKEPRWLHTINKPCMAIPLLTGKEGVQTFFELQSTKKNLIQTPELKIQEFPFGGYYIAKARLNKIPFWLMFDGGDYGMNGWGGHGHNDCLSFELFIGDSTFIGDSGTGCYTSNQALRNSFRSTKAHNTVMVEETEQVQFGTLWRITEDTLHPSVISHQSGNTGVFVAHHNGYVRHFGHKHQRIFFIDAAYNTLSVSDELLAHESQPFQQSKREQSIKGTIQYIIPGSLSCRQYSKHEVVVESRQFSCKIFSNNQIEIQAAQVSPSYRVFHSAYKLNIPITNAEKVHTTFHWCERENQA